MRTLLMLLLFAVISLAQDWRPPAVPTGSNFVTGDPCGFTIEDAFRSQDRECISYGASKALTLQMVFGKTSSRRYTLEPLAAGVAHTYHIRGVPDRGKPFTMVMAEDGPICSIYECMDRIHKRAHWWSFHHRKGMCIVEPNSIHGGRCNRLERKYPDINIGVFGISP